MSIISAAFFEIPNFIAGILFVLISVILAAFSEISDSRAKYNNRKKLEIQVIWFVHKML
jgi:hypothetical protein